MERYLTRRHVAVTMYEAQRLAQLDGTPIHRIRHTPNVYLVHRTEWWAWWSDECLTPAVSLPDSLCPEGLSPDAVDLISAVWESFSPPPQCGWSILARVAQVVRVERFQLRFPSHVDASWTDCERLTVRYQEGEVGVLYRFWAVIEGNYWCDISETLPDSD